MVNEIIVVLLTISIVLFSAFLHLCIKSYIVSIDWDAEYQEAKEMEERVKELKVKIEATGERISKLTSKH